MTMCWRGLCLLPLTLLGSCDDVVGPEEVPLGIRGFLAEQVEPPLRSYSTILAPDGESLVFRVSWGAPLDCPSGCFFLSGSGIMVGQRVGWLTPLSIQLLETPKYFEAEAADTVVFSSDLLSRIEAADPGAATDLSLRIGCSAAAGEELLYRVARRVQAKGVVTVAQAVVEHPDGRPSVRILEILTRLVGSRFAWVTAEAGRVLTALERAESPPSLDPAVRRACWQYRVGRDDL